MPGRSSNSLEQRDHLVGLQPLIGLRIDQVTAVARHAHVLQRDHQPALVGLGEELEPPPLLHDAGDVLLVLGVDVALQLRHRHEDGAVDALGQLVEHLVLLPAQQDRRERLAEPVEVAVADHLADVVADLVVVQQAKRRAEAVRSTNCTIEISSSSRFSSGVPVRTMA